MFKNDSNYLDQHFLIDKNTINKFIDTCNLKETDVVVEIGPGMGVLTKKIAPKVKRLIAIEKDLRLKKYLEEIPNTEIIYEDALKIEIPKCDKIITAIPYSIIEPFIYKLINTDFKELYMIMGSSYVYKVINKELNNLSLLTNTFFESTKYFDIPKECFNPIPDTLSSVIKLVPKKTFTEKELIIKNLYLQDDKKIKNALSESLITTKNITKKESKALIEKLNLPEELLDKKFNVVSNDELKILYESLN